MDIDFAKKTAVDLIKKSKTAMLGTIDDKGYPNMKAMLNLHTDDMKTIWFSTNTSSKRVKQILANSKSSVYYFDQGSPFMGLMLLGKIEVLHDKESKKMLWSDGFEKYYSKGINDPDYCVLKFTTEQANFYTGLENITFTID